MFPYQLSDEKPAKTIQFLVKQPNFWAYFGAKMTLMTFLIRNERVIFTTTSSNVAVTAREVAKRVVS